MGSEDKQYNLSQKSISVEHGEVCILTLLFLLGALCVYPSNPNTNFLIPEVLTSVAYSRAVGLALIVLCVIRSVALLKRAAKGEGSGARMGLTFALIGCVLIFVYGLLFSYVGFYSATAALMFLMSYYLENKEDRSAVKCVIFTVVTILVIAVSFRLFKIYLPPAWII